MNQKTKLTTLILVGIVLAASIPMVSAAPGDILKVVTVPVPSSPAVGIDYDGTNILYTNSYTNNIYKTDINGNNLGSIPLINPDNSPFTGDGLNAITYNVNNGMLYGGGWNSTNLYKTDLNTGITTLVKANALAGYDQWHYVDGLAWDPTDNTFWMSDDVNDNVRHLDINGNDTGGFKGSDINLPVNSGLAVALDGTLWYGTNGAGLIYRLDSNPLTNLGVFSDPGGRDEAMVCGQQSPPLHGPIDEPFLSKGAWDSTFSIIEVAPGTCVSPAGPDASVPEFPTMAMPVIAVIGLMFLFQRRKGN